jgi:DNA-binding response OmpR family regulator
MSNCGQLEYTYAGRSMANKILVVEDDKTLLDLLKYNLEKEGHQVVTAMDGAEAIEKARSSPPDAIILDIMLPSLNGLEVCRILRKEMTTSILMLTARDDEIDKISGLDAGADDYMTKPFSMRELLARVRAILRRAEHQAVPAGEQIRTGDIEIDVGRHTIRRGGNMLSLTPKEFELLAFLARNKGLVFTRDQLLEKVWGYDFAGDTRTVDVHVRWLRSKIEDDPDEPRRLLTVRGVGYKLEG